MENKNITTKIIVCSYEELTETEKKLVDTAKEASNRSYAPYSRFQVGAAALLSGGLLISGSNQENAAYPSGICAERPPSDTRNRGALPSPHTHLSLRHRRNLYRRVDTRPVASLFREKRPARIEIVQKDVYLQGSNKRRSRRHAASRPCPANKGIYPPKHRRAR